MDIKKYHEIYRKENMNKIYFIGRIKECSDDRDSVIYTETPEFVCEHYFGNRNFVGPNFSTSFGISPCFNKNSKDLEYEELETPLTEIDYKRLVEIEKLLKDLGYGIEKDSDKYKKGKLLCQEFINILEQYTTNNQEITNKIKQDEAKQMMDKYNLSSDQVKEIIENYPGDYWDKGIIINIFEDSKELAEHNFYEFYGDTNDVLKEYFNFEKFGEYIIQDENYYELDDGRIIEYGL